MKRFLHIVSLLVMFLFMTSTSVSAQLRYGFRFGGDIASARLKNAGDATLRNGGGFSGGFVFEYQMPKCGFAPTSRYSTHAITPVFPKQGKIR